MAINSGASSLGRSFKDYRKSFFDAPAVLRAMDKGTRKALSRFGAFVRTRSKSSIRKAPAVDPHNGQRVRRSKKRITVDATARPGDPPYSHDGTLKKLIFFAYDASTKSVVIGPAKSASRRGGGPEFIEHGGTTTLLIGKKGKSKTAHFRSNPFMQPARDAELPGLITGFKDCLEE